MTSEEQHEIRRRLEAMVEVLKLAEGEHYGIAYGSKFTTYEVAARLSDARTALPRLLDALERSERERDAAIRCLDLAVALDPPAAPPETEVTT